MTATRFSTARVAAIDIGTNTVLLLVAERAGAGAGAGELVAVHEVATITRLGQGVDKTKTLAPEAIARTRACLANYAEQIRAHGVATANVGVVGTSAMRDAHGGQEVVQAVRDLLGVERVIAGEEEARLTFMGALGGMRDVTHGAVVVFDIGGGSTEMVRGDMPSRTIAFATSLDVGSVRLTERHLRSDPPSAAEKAALVADVQLSLRKLGDAGPLAALRSAEPIGIAGTVTTLAAVARAIVPYDGAKVHGARIELEELRATVDRLAALPLAERASVPGLEPKRADVIVAGGLLTLTLLEALGATSLRISDRGVRWGLAEELSASATGEAGEPG